MAEGTHGNGFISRYTAILGTIGVVALFVGAFWASVVGPMRDAVHDLAIEKLSRTEHEEFARRLDAAISAMRDDIAKQIDRDDHRIERIENGLVSRSEHETHWREDADRAAELSGRLNELRTQVSSAYTIGDQVRALQKQIDDLRAERAAHP